MIVLTDKFVVDPKPLDQVLAEEKTRRHTARFERQARDIIPPATVHCPNPINPLAEALSKVRLP